MIRPTCTTSSARCGSPKREFHEAIRYVNAVGQATTPSHNEAMLGPGLSGGSNLGLPAEQRGAGNARDPRQQRSGTLLARGRPALTETRRLDPCAGRPRARPSASRGRVRDPAGPAGRRRRDRCLAFVARRTVRKPRRDAGGHEPARQVSPPRRGGSFGFASVKPAGYPVPTHGPTGALLARAEPPQRPPGARALPHLQARLQDHRFAGLRPAGPAPRRPTASSASPRP